MSFLLRSECQIEDNRHKIDALEIITPLIYYDTQRNEVIIMKLKYRRYNIEAKIQALYNQGTKNTWLLKLSITL